MRRMSVARFAGMTLVVGGLSLVMLVPAWAVTATETLSPASNQLAGKTVKVTVKNFEKSKTGLFVIECNGDNSIPRSAGAGCNLAGKGSLNTDATGAGSATLTLKATNPMSSSALGDCPLSAADYKAGIGCVIAVADPANSSNANATLYFAPGKVTATANPKHSGTSTLTLSGNGWATFGLPKNCLGATGAIAPGNPTNMKCTSVVGEIVTIKVNGVTVGTATAQPAKSGAISFSHSVTLKKGTNTITLSGGTSKETASATIITTA